MRIGQKRYGTLKLLKKELSAHVNESQNIDTDHVFDNIPG